VPAVSLTAIPRTSASTPARPEVTALLPGAPSVSISAGELIPGPPGPEGPPGPASRWFFGPGPPTAPCGDWDFWLDVTSWDVWSCASATPAKLGAARPDVTALTGR
jgi:hypothetical protein